MKKVNYSFLLLLILFISICHVNASCTNEEIANLRELADSIKITYRHLGKVVTDDGSFHYNSFDVNVKNISNDLYVLTLANTIKLIPENEIINTTLGSGNWIFNIYSNKCDEKITEINFVLPKFNTYSLDPLCNGISGDDFPLCGKYYEHDVSYENFKERVNHYRLTHNITNSNNEEKSVNFLTSIFEKVIYILKEYTLYIIFAFIIILMLIISIIFVKRKNKRGVL